MPENTVPDGISHSERRTPSHKIFSELPLLRDEDVRGGNPDKKILKKHLGMPQVNENPWIERPKDFGKLCVVTAIEKALGVQATPEECWQRDRDVKQLEKQLEDPTIDKIQASIGDYETIYRYYEDLATHDTPLGRTLRDHTLSLEYLDLAEASERMSERGRGDQTLVVVPAPNSNKGSHITRFIGFMENSYNGRAMGVLTDDGSIPLDSELAYPWYMFKPKSSTPNGDQI
jgi:hypothetical protein